MKKNYILKHVILELKGQTVLVVLFKQSLKISLIHANCNGAHLNIECFTFSTLTLLIGLSL